MVDGLFACRCDSPAVLVTFARSGSWAPAMAPGARCANCDRPIVWSSLAEAAAVVLAEDLAALEAPSAFAAAFEAFAVRVHSTAIAKGWWESGDRNDGEVLALIHSEVSEALEALRAGNPPDDKVPEFSGAEAELADVVIRIMDVAARKGWRVGPAIVAKAAFNAGRPHKHGGKRF